MKSREERVQPLKQSKAGISSNSSKQQIPAKRTHNFLRRSSLSKGTKAVIKPSTGRKSPIKRSEKAANKENRGELQGFWH